MWEKEKKRKTPEKIVRRCRRRPVPHPSAYGRQAQTRDEWCAGLGSAREDHYHHRYIHKS